MSIFGQIHRRNVNIESRKNPAAGTDLDTEKIERKVPPAESWSALLQLLIGGLAVAYRRRLKTLAIEIFRAAIKGEFDHRDDDDHGVTWNSGSEFTIERD